MNIFSEWSQHLFQCRIHEQSGWLFCKLYKEKKHSVYSKLGLSFLIGTSLFKQVLQWLAHSQLCGNSPATIQIHADVQGRHYYLLLCWYANARAVDCLGFFHCTKLPLMCYILAADFLLQLHRFTETDFKPFAPNGPFHDITVFT